MKLQGKLWPPVLNAARAISNNKSMRKGSYTGNLGLFMFRIFRSANIDISFIRSTDLFRAFFDSKWDEVVFGTDQNDDLRKLLVSLKKAKIGHLVPFAQLLPRMIINLLSEAKRNASFVQNFLCESSTFVTRPACAHVPSSNRARCFSSFVLWQFRFRAT